MGMNFMVYQEMSCAAIHDVSGVGKCSLTVALPVLSACGVETAVMPTAVLSTHTGGFTGYTFTDMTEEMLPMARHWKAVGCKFSALYSGFLGSPTQADILGEIFGLLGDSDTLLCVDPVLGDGGKLYATCTPELAAGMARLCRKAGLIIPNMTEAAYLLGGPYLDGPMTHGQVEEILSGLRNLGPKMAVLTGVRVEGGLGAASMDAAGQVFYHVMEEIPGYYHGTGDLFASTLVGALLNGMDLSEACRTAVEFTHQVIETTREYSKDYKFGPKFEVCLPQLAAKMEQFRKENSR